MSKVVSLESLAQEIPSGATIAIGGFQLSRVPIALIHAIAAGKNTDFKAVSAPNPLALEILSAAGCLRSAECAFIGFQYEDGFAIAPAVCHAIATGELDLQQPDVYDTIQSLRATGDKGRQNADFALLHVHLADTT
ncbi:MAG: CoA-transferase, partial [Acidobacteriota bacterium]|nr:CoA-transferase [Acidobacteriota bacterium]